MCVFALLGFLFCPTGGPRRCRVTKESARTKKLSDERPGDSSKKRRVRFDLQELGRRDQEEPRRKAGERELSTADDSECDDSAAQNTKSDSNRFAVT